MYFLPYQMSLIFLPGKIALYTFVIISAAAVTQAWFDASASSVRRVPPAANPARPTTRRLTYAVFT